MSDEKHDPQGSQPSQSAAQAPGNSQVTNPNKVIGDGDEVAQDSEQPEG